MELAPLTILVGSNNSGKTALAQAIQLLAGALAPPGKDPEPLPLESGGIRHGDGFEDLLTGRAVHGSLTLSAAFSGTNGDLSLSATVQNVEAPPRTSMRQITEWRLSDGKTTIAVERQGLNERSSYLVSTLPRESHSRRIKWLGLLPHRPESLSQWTAAQADALKVWAKGIRHLQCPRHIRPSPFTLVDDSFRHLGPQGRDAPMVLAADDQLRESVKAWYRSAFGVNIEMVPQGRYFDLEAGSAHHGNVRLTQSGQGLSHVLPVVVMALTARREGPGVDIIEHPEAELHPASHAQITELLLENLVGPTRPMVVETHSDILLLRARRWIAEGRLSPSNVLVYWIRSEPRRGSIVRQIRITKHGEMTSWPEGVFIEDYEEVMAIRRAARTKR